jgi:hypothetical protein
MPSTYTLNNGIELIATGEQSGTWGDTTNVNLALIDTALDGQVTITLASAGSSGSPNALPISDGSASNGRNRLVIFDDGGDLGATAFVQLTPNDAEKIVYIRNNLSGGRAITLFQGTYNASNDYEVPAGTTAVVFFNGGGAGAVAANVFNNAFFDSLRLGGVSVTAILDEDNMASDSATALATQQSIKAYVDAQVGANNELSEILANGNTSGGNNIQMTTTDEVQFRDTALKISSSVDGQLDIAADVELEIVAPTLDINASTAVTIDTTTMTMTGSVNVVGDLDVDNLNINGNSIISTNTDGNIALTPNGTGEVDISKVDIDGGTIDGTVIGGSTPAAISGTTGQFGTSLNVDGTVTANGVAIDGDSITANAQNALTFEFATATGIISADRTGGNFGELSLRTTAGSTPLQRLNISYDGDISFYEDTGTTPKFFWDASAESLGIGTSSPAYRLHVTNASGYVSAFRGTTAATSGILVGNTVADTAIQTLASGDSLIGSDAGRYLAFGTNGFIERMRIDSSGNVGIGTNSPAQKLHVSTAGNNYIVSHNTAGSTSALLLGAESGSTSIYSWTTPTGSTGVPLKFFTGASEAMRIDASGNVGIGTTDFAVGKLAVDGNISINASTAGRFTWNNSGAYLNWIESDGVSGNNFVRFGVENAERMRITSAGAVGIGTSSPNKSSSNLALTVNAASGQYPAIELSTGDTGRWYINADATNVYDTAMNNTNRTFYTGGSERMRITSTGSVGIGTSSPAVKLTSQLASSGISGIPSTAAALFENSGNSDVVIAAGTSSKSRIAFGDSGDWIAGRIDYDHSDNSMRFGTAGSGERLCIDASGNVGIGTGSPADKLVVNKGSAGTIATFTDGVNSNFVIETASLITTVGNTGGSTALAFKSANAERMRIDASGNLLVGTTTVHGQITSLSDGTKFQYASYNTDTSGVSQISFRFIRNGVDVGSITTTSSATAFNISQACSSGD